jgi:PAS domain S-box-containing protein
MWEWKPGSAEVYYSPLLKRQMGYEDHEIANRADTWLQHVHPEDLPATQNKVAASTRSPWPRYENEYRLRHKDGSYRWIRAVGSMLLDDDGKPLRTLGTQQDITDAKRAQVERERLLAEQFAARAEADAAQQRVAHILESVSDAFVALDRDWRYVYVNQKAAQIFGRSSEDLLGRHIWTEFPEGVGQPFYRAYQKAMNERTYQFLEEYYPPYDRWFENRIYPSADGISIFFHDISERKLAEGALRTTEAQLHELLMQFRHAQEAERIRISRQVHDELGQLLTGLKMDLRWLERKLGEPDVPPHLNPLLDRAVAASELADQTIGSVQRIAAELRPPALDQLGLAAALSQDARRFEERSGLPCTVKVSPPEPELSASVSSELFYICHEALTNVARHALATRVEIELSAQDGQIVVDICDDGVGIDPAQVHGRHSLGLLGMRERALQCGGTLQVQRRKSRGTRVTVRVPMAAPTQVRSP